MIAQYLRYILIFYVSTNAAMAQMTSEAPQKNVSAESNQTIAQDVLYDRVYNDLKKKYSSYDRRIRPFIGVKPVEVDIFLYVSSLRSISEATMDYKLELYFREYWQDPRMSYDPLLYNNMSRISLHESFAELLWIPDTFLPNAVHSENPDHRSITHRALLRLEPDGHLLYSRRLSVVAECPMDLSLYPFDQQVCMLSIESYGYDMNDIIYRWVKTNPIVLNKNLELPDFKLRTVVTKTHNVTLATGTYSRLEACFFFHRNSAFYFVQLFIPATAIVVTSWLSLYMARESTFSDMIEVILAITFLYYSYNTVMPRVSYIKAMDIYLGACFIFVFLSLIKLAALKMMQMRSEDHEQRHKRRLKRQRSVTYRPRAKSPVHADYSLHKDDSDSCEELTGRASRQSDEDALRFDRAYCAMHGPATPLVDAAGYATATPPSGAVIANQSALRTCPHWSPLTFTRVSLDASEGFRSRQSPVGSKVRARTRVLTNTHLENRNGEVRLNAPESAGRTGTSGNILSRAGSRFTRRRRSEMGMARGTFICKRAFTYSRIVSVLMFPLSFLGFCIFYFVVYFWLAVDKSQSKCNFDE